MLVEQRAKHCLPVPKLVLFRLDHGHVRKYTKFSLHIHLVGKPETEANILSRSAVRIGIQNGENSSSKITQLAGSKCVHVSIECQVWICEVCVTFGFSQIYHAHVRKDTRLSPQLVLTVLQATEIKARQGTGGPTLFFFFPPLAVRLLSSCFLLRYSVRLSSPLSPSSSSSTSEWRRFLLRNTPTASSLSGKGEEREKGGREEEERKEMKDCKIHFILRPSVKPGRG